eukprot:TRINITY_DN18984_c0_g1_i1.p1 TRINITY_DN18984_c0_g1~~TRINITY_DN18984_c0_g1_i1.p1  ORF type:complete len:208 (+),score=77.19 TRINITY_DN18984_c0_g1_i1:3-626(+)
MIDQSAVLSDPQLSMNLISSDITYQTCAERLQKTKSDIIEDVTGQHAGLVNDTMHLLSTPQNALAALWHMRSLLIDSQTTLQEIKRQEQLQLIAMRENQTKKRKEQGGSGSGKEKGKGKEQASSSSSVNDQLRQQLQELEQTDDRGTAAPQLTGNNKTNTSNETSSSGNTKSKSKKATKASKQIQRNKRLEKKLMFFMSWICGPGSE